MLRSSPKHRYCDCRHILAALPAGTRITEGGAIEESTKANEALFKVLPVMFLIMLTLIMFQVKSFSRMFLVFVTFPLGFIGASYALYLTSQPFGFVALLGSRILDIADRIVEMEDGRILSEAPSGANTAAAIGLFPSIAR